MHKTVSAFTIQHYISHTFQLLTDLISKTAETNASWPRPRPRPQNFGLESWDQDCSLED